MAHLRLQVAAVDHRNDGDHDHRTEPAYITESPMANVSTVEALKSTVSARARPLDGRSQRLL
jgi:hypothetical protein